MKNSVKMISVIIICLLQSSCFTTCKPGGKDIIPPRQIPEIKTDLALQAEKVGEVRDAITEKANSVKTETTSIESETEQGETIAPAPQWGSIRERAKKIRDSAQEILEKGGDLTDVQVKLATAKSEVDTLKEYTKEEIENAAALRLKIEEQEKSIEEFKTGAKKQQRSIMMTAIAIGGIMSVVGILILFYVSPKAGAPLIMTGVAVSSVAWFMVSYAWVVAIAGGVFFIMIIGYVIYFAANNRKAFLETVTSFEIAKGKEWTDPKTKTEISTIQSNKTKQMVKDIKFKENIG